MSWLEHRIPPPIVVLIVAAVMWPLGAIAPALPVDDVWRFVGAGTLTLAGLFVAGAGVGRFARAKTTINPVDIGAASSLVTTGVFAYTRNPMYLGMVLLLVGWSLFLGSAWTLLGPIGFFAFIARFQIVPEERVMAKLFGPQYENYRRRVRRWI